MVTNVLSEDLRCRWLGVKKIIIIPSGHYLGQKAAAMAPTLVLKGKFYKSTGVGGLFKASLT